MFQKVLHEVRDLMPIVSVNPVARRRKGAKDPPRTQRVRTGGKGEAAVEGYRDRHDIYTVNFAPSLGNPVLPFLPGSFMLPFLPGCPSSHNTQ